MLTGHVRPVEHRNVTVEGEDLALIMDGLERDTPAGWELAKSPVAMGKRSSTLTVEATYVRRDGIQEIEAEDMDALRAKVPEGYELLSVVSY